MVVLLISPDIFYMAAIQLHYCVYFEVKIHNLGDSTYSARGLALSAILENRNLCLYTVQPICVQ